MDKFQNKYRIQSSRLQNWDYRNEGYYFITICTKNNEHFFGTIENNKMILSEIGQIANQYWLEIPNHFHHVSLGPHIIMPNHVHCIIIIDESVPVQTMQSISVQTLHATSVQEKMSSISPKPGSLSTIIRSYKSAVTKEAHTHKMDFAWQSRFYDHIIRDIKSLQNIEEYIINNPVKWSDDEYCKNK